MISTLPLVEPKNSQIFRLGVQVIPLNSNSLVQINFTESL
jgi:hypothetical protein